jgi:hypothetical protein
MALKIYGDSSVKAIVCYILLKNLNIPTWCGKSNNTLITFFFIDYACSGYKFYMIPFFLKVRAICSKLTSEFSWDISIEPFNYHVFIYFLQIVKLVFGILVCYFSFVVNRVLFIQIMTMLRLHQVMTKKWVAFCKGTNYAYEFWLGGTLPSIFSTTWVRLIAYFEFCWSRQCLAISLSCRTEWWR